jgi:CRP-like cAMP-binding protein
MPKAPYNGGNLLLDRLPPNDLAALSTDLEERALPANEVLYGGGSEDDFRHVWFPIDAVTSMLTMMGDGSAVEAGTVGREGLVGFPSALGSVRMLARWICQVPGISMQIDRDRFRTHFDERPALREIVDRYNQSFVASLAQSVACNRLHQLYERCARWLLLTHDRVGRDEFPLTQEFLAMMLGVRRPGVSVAAATLAGAGFISYIRGRIKVLDRAGLESACCECYAVVRDEYDRIFEAPLAQM